MLPGIARLRTIALGSLVIDKVLEMEGVDLPLGESLPGVSAADLATLSTWYRSEELTECVETSSLRLSFHSYVLRARGQNILIDPCNGNDKIRTIDALSGLRTNYLSNLTAIGLQPDDIDVVVCTHLHCDHVGWNTKLENGRWVPTFPNARYLLSKKDFEYFNSDLAPVIDREPIKDSVMPVVDAGLAELVGMDHIVQGRVGDGVWFEPAQGHTPGNITVRAQSGGARAVFSGDVFHHPVQLVRPELAVVFDYDSNAAARVRRRVLESVAATDDVLFPAHFPGKSAGRVRRAANGFHFEFLPEA